MVSEVGAGWGKGKVGTDLFELGLSLRHGVEGGYAWESLWA